MLQGHHPSSSNPGWKCVWKIDVPERVGVYLAIDAWKAACE
jgi:hypothetical protein